MSEPILELRGISCAYDAQGESLPVLKNLDLSIFSGQRIGLFAPNGAGKTTLFRCITGLTGISSGEIIFHARPMRTEKDFCGLRKRVGFVLQNAEDQLFFPTVLEDAAFGPLNQGYSRDEAEARAAAALKAVGLAGMEKRLVHHLSGGQQKLLAIAGILAMDPELLLLDEPGSALDACALDNLQSLLCASGKAMIVVAHDLAFLRKCSGQLLTLGNGRLLPLAGHGQDRP